MKNGMQQKKWWSELVVPVTAVLAGLLLGAILMLAMGTNPIAGYSALIRGSFGSLVNMSDTIVYINPLIFTGLSIAVAYRCGLFNIGAEGQLIVGMVASAYVGYKLAGMPRVIHLPLTVLAGAMAGAIWGAVPGYLKAKLGVHEVVNSIMMNYIALYLSHYLVMGPIKDPRSALPYSREIADTAKLTRFIGGFGSEYRANTGILIAIAAVIIVYYLIYKTTVGYEIRMVGFNSDAAKYAGIDAPRAMTLSMVVAGALAGLAGAVQITGIQYKFLDLFAFEGFGFDGIAVALVAKSNPIGILASASLFGILQKGSQTMQALAEVPKETVGIVQAVIIFLVAAEGLIQGWLPGGDAVRSLFGRARKTNSAQKGEDA